LHQYLWEFDQLAAIQDAWLQRVVFDVASDRHAIWQHLRESTRQKCEQIEAKIVQVFEYKVAGIRGHEVSTLMADASALKDHIDAGGRLGFMLQANPFAPKHVKAALYVSRTIRV